MEVSIKNFRNAQISLYVAENQDGRFLAEVRYDGKVGKSEDEDSEYDAIGNALWDLSNVLDAAALEAKTKKED